MEEAGGGGGNSNELYNSLLSTETILMFRLNFEPKVYFPVNEKLRVKAIVLVLSPLVRTARAPGECAGYPMYTPYEGLN